MNKERYFQQIALDKYMNKYDRFMAGIIKSVVKEKSFKKIKTEMFFAVISFMRKDIDYILKTNKIKKI